MRDTVLIAGAGLSAVAGIPTTGELTKRFLSQLPTAATPKTLQDAISEELEKYWRVVFGFTGNAPTFEDHFTVLDLAANTGHHLGTRYSPKQLRAIRRLSIHRVFEILDQRFDASRVLTEFLAKLQRGRNNGIITTNWDISPERHAKRPFHYSIPVSMRSPYEPESVLWPTRGTAILKLHGSSNWSYCDCCGRLYASNPEFGKTAVKDKIFIDNDDFMALRPKDRLPPRKIFAAHCPDCGVRLSSRVATFSYAKTLNFVHFLAIWDDAFKLLREANNWIFVGYSFPEADFQLRHMLKAAQLGRRRAEAVRVKVVTRGDEDFTISRFERFFGRALVEYSVNGFEEWGRSAR